VVEEEEEKRMGRRNSRREGEGQSREGKKEGGDREGRRRYLQVDLAILYLGNGNELLQCLHLILQFWV